jgi:transcriptional repressor NrdR
VRCPYCGHVDSKVIDSRDAHEGIRRRRECVLCGLRFTTYERIQAAALLVIKHDGRSELYNRDKLANSIRIACAKRPLPLGTIDKVVDDVEGELQKLGRAEIPTTRIGEMVIYRLRELDRVAYIRFASVYRDFQDVESFRREAEALQAGQGRETESTSVDISRGTEIGRRVRRAKLKPQSLPMNLTEGKV